jgi:hypothetical protein
MTFLHNHRSRLQALVILVVMGFALALATTAHAQPESKKKSAKPQAQQAYLLPYILTVVMLGIGVAVVCLPSHRHDDVKPLAEDD